MDVPLLRYSLRVRAGFLLLQLVANWLLPDHVSDGFVAPRASDEHSRPLDAAVTRLLAGLHRWDAQHLLHVAQHGYTHEPTLAFLPGWPLLVRAAAAPLTAAGLLSTAPALLLAAVLLSTALSAAAAQALLALSARVLRRPRRARAAARLFCWSPGTVFLLAPYAESLFACLTMVGLLLCHRRRLWGAAAAFGLAAATRSNGLLLPGFLLCALAEDQLAAMFPAPVKENVRQRGNLSLLIEGCGRLILAAALGAFSLAAYAVHQLYVYILYCTSHLPEPLPPHVQAYTAGMVTPGDMASPWCNHTLPLSYGYIQEQYWDVGFLRYWHWKQIPNFILAAPMFILVLYGAATYLGQLVVQLRGRTTGGATVDAALLPYMAHAAFLAVFMLFCAHVQVVTRLLAAASPVPYWLAAQCLQPDEQPAGQSSSTSSLTTAQRLEELSTNEVGPPSRQCAEKQSYYRSEHRCAGWKVLGVLEELGQEGLPPKRRRIANAVTIYFVSYAVVGTVLFSNNLPWT